jgi:hypothetical protein
MADPHRLIAAALVATLIASSAAAQQTSSAPPAVQPTRNAPSAPQDLEPSVDTSAPVAPSAAPSAPSAPAAQVKAVSAAKSAARPPAPAGSADARSKSGAKDRMELDPTQITGNRELPKVLYIVPWKHADLSDLAGRPSNSLLDEVLAPVDRDVFQRENRYYEALQPDAPRAGNVPQATSSAGAAGAAAPPARDEK